MLERTKKQWEELESEMGVEFLYKVSLKRDTWVKKT